MKKKYLSFIRILCFILVLAIMLSYTNKVFKVKHGDGIYDMTTFYKLNDNTVDVLILGSSHAFENINTGTLWNEYGMAFYILAGSVQPLWNTYYYLKEALKTQTPELIILEGFCTILQEDYVDDSWIIKNTYGLKWSADKLNAIKVSSPRERWREFIPEYTQYHTRYTELSKFDFFQEKADPLYRDWKGFGCNMATTPLESTNITVVDTRTAMFKKTEEYYRKTIELAIENQIPIFITITPYAGINQEDEAIFNTASDIASEYGITFLDCNRILSQIGIDYTTDAADASHLNYKGSQKLARFLGGYLTEHYALSDRRNDSTYATWQRSADYTSQLIYDQELRESMDIDTVANRLSNENYRLFISLDGNCTMDNEYLQSFYSSLKLTGIADAGGIWYRDNALFAAEGYIWSAQGIDDEQFLSADSHDVHLKRTADADVYTNHIIIDNTEYKKVENGVNIIVYDTVTESIADIIGVDADKDYSIVR